MNAQTSKITAELTDAQYWEAAQQRKLAREARNANRAAIEQRRRIADITSNSQQNRSR
jgi:hypothetical protein